MHSILWKQKWTGRSGHSSGQAGRKIPGSHENI